MDREFEPNLDDAREVDLSDEAEQPPAPPTLDPDERVEDANDEDVQLDDERPA